MRIIFIAGFGEEEFIFDRIRAGLPGEHLVLSLWNELPDKAEPTLDALLFARRLVHRYGIKNVDLVIGHSTGGWVALYIGQEAGCAVIQVSSWTDPKKVVVPTSNRHLVYIVARTGIFWNRWMLRRSLRRSYNGKPSAEVFTRIFLRLQSGNRANIVNQLRLIFNPITAPATIRPALRIHAREDGVVHLPDESYHEVPGDHFSLYTHPEDVVAPIRQFVDMNFRPNE